MQTERLAILRLLALGRITPAQAERLLIAWNEGRDSRWLLVACILTAWMASIDPRYRLADLLHTASSLLPGSFAFLRHTLSLVSRLFGGTL
jgi:hypothetical protein